MYMPVEVVLCIVDPSTIEGTILLDSGNNCVDHIIEGGLCTNLVVSITQVNYICCMFLN